MASEQVVLVRGWRPAAQQRLSCRPGRLCCSRCGRPCPGGGINKVLKSRPGTATAPLVLNGEDAADFLRAYAEGDTDTLKALLADQIDMHELANWDGEVTRSCTITEITEVEISE